jgi:hypothetical protein
MASPAVEVHGFNARVGSGKSPHEPKTNSPLTMNPKTEGLLSPNPSPPEEARGVSLGKVHGLNARTWLRGTSSDSWTNRLRKALNEIESGNCSGLFAHEVDLTAPELKLDCLVPYLGDTSEAVLIHVIAFQREQRQAAGRR